MTAPNLAFAEHFADLPDPRIDRTKKHLLIDVLAVTLCATIAGADSFEEVERFGRSKESWLRGFLSLPNGIPSHDTFNRVFAALGPRKFNECVTRWLAAVCEAAGLRHVAIDGKSARSAPRDTFSGRLHLVSAWAGENPAHPGPAGGRRRLPRDRRHPTAAPGAGAEGGAGEHRRGRLPEGDR